MTSVAAKLLDDFKALAPDEQIFVRQELISLTQALQREAMARLRGASAERRLLARLLTERAGERARG